MKRTINIVKYTFFLMGLAFVIGGGVALERTLAFRQSAEEATGRVVDLVRGQDTYAPLVEYRAADGQTYTFVSSTSSNPPRYNPGEEVPVLYDPGDPYHARIDRWMETWFLPLLFGFVGLVFTGVGGGMLAHGRMKKQRRAWLATHGKRIEARFVGVEQNGSLRVNGRHPWRLTCQWHNPDTHEVHVFHSDDLWFDPSGHIDRGSLDVLIDPRNPRRYHVDISFLPRLAS